MTKTSRGHLPSLHSGGGVSRLRCDIIASTCSDMGACIMCARCGHVFLPSKPLSDESEPGDNVELAKALYYHMCTMPPPARKVMGTGKHGKWADKLGSVTQAYADGVESLNE